MLNSETGAIVALMQYSEAKSGTEGGAAIPIERAADQLEEVAACLEEPPSSTRRWRKAIGEEAWEDLGRPNARQARVDLFLNGDNSSWSVRIDGEAAHSLTARDLPDEISQALFHWAQRRRVRNEEDVRLLGRLLSGAIFPSKVASTLQRECGADELLIRLHIDPDSDLFDIPWELATLTIDNLDSHVGAHERLGMVRVVKGTELKGAPLDQGARVLAAVVQLESLQAQMPTLTFGTKKVRWPADGEIGQALESAVSMTPLQPEVMEI